MNDSTLKQSQSWWEANPMSYDWNEKIDGIKPDHAYFNLVDQRMREGHHFAQKRNVPLFSNLIPYPMLAGKHVLEIGCGLGSIAQVFANHGALYTGVDLTERSIQLCSLRFRLSQLKGHFVQTNAEKLPFPDNSFDYVWSWGVIHHTPGTKEVIREIKRVLKPGGRLAVMMYNRYSLRNFTRVVLMRGILQLKFLSHSLEELENRYSDGFIAKHYSQKTMKALFQDFGDVKLSIYGQRSEIFPGYHRLPKILTFPFEPILQKILRKAGWFLFIEGQK